MSRECTNARVEGMDDGRTSSGRAGSMQPIRLGESLTDNVNVRTRGVVKIAQLDVELPPESERLQEVVQEWLGKKRAASGKVQAVLRILDPGQLRCVTLSDSRIREDGGEAARARF